MNQAMANNGCFLCRRGVELSNFLSGGGQEQGRRGGTENVLLITALGAAAALAKEELQQTAQHMAAMRDLLQEKLVAIFGAVSSPIAGACMHCICCLAAVQQENIAAVCCCIRVLLKLHRVYSTSETACCCGSV
jgi:cysteine sulfinate desulfinase/cysteine desulfurase-like protein